MTIEDKSKGLRNKIFLASSFLIFYVYFLNDYFNWYDECLATYAILISSGIISLFFGSWWWFICRKATDVFKWLMTLIFGETFAHIFNFYARYLNINDRKIEYGMLMDSSLWKYRGLITAISLIYISCLMLARIIKDYKIKNGGK